MINKICNISRISFVIFIILFLVLNFNIVVIGAPGDTSLSISPANQTIETSETFTIEVYCEPSEPIKGFELEISYDSSLVKAITVSEGDIFVGYSNFFSSGDIDNSEGIITGIYGLIVGQGTTASAGTFCNITFTSKTKIGTSQIEFNKIGDRTGVVNEVGYISIEVNDGSVTIEKPDDPQDPPEQPPPSQPSPPPYVPPPVEKENNPPEPPLIPAGPIFVESGVVYIYETSTFDKDEDQIRIRFELGDGNYSKWSNYISSNITIGVSYSWNNPSNYSVRAIAQDIYGLNSSWSDSQIITVSEADSGKEPIISISLTSVISTNETIIFDASETLDPDGAIISYHWDFGDGNGGTNKIQTHSYQNPGKFTVKLTVTDNIGYSYSKTMIVNIEDIGVVTTVLVGEESSSGILDSLVFLILGVLILENFLFLLILKPNLRKPVSKNFKNSYSRILKWLARRKIERLDSKISKVSEGVKFPDFSNNIEPIKMTSSEDNLVQSPTYENIPKDISLDDKHEIYNSDSYDNLLDDNIDDPEDSQSHESYITQSFEQNNKDDINSMVDELILSKTQVKTSDFDKSVERIIDNYKDSKKFDRDN